MLSFFFLITLLLIPFCTLNSLIHPTLHSFKIRPFLYYCCMYICIVYVYTHVLNMNNEQFAYSQMYSQD